MGKKYNDKLRRGGRMTDFEKRWGKLTVGEALELNKKAQESMGDPSIEDEA